MSGEVRAAARRIINEQGAEALTLAEVARRVGVTPAALYRHFDDLADIVRSTAADIVAELTAALQQSVADSPENDLASRLIAPCRTFRSWSLRNRAEFSLLFGTPTMAAGDAHVELTNTWVSQLSSVWGPVFLRLWSEQPFPVLTDEDLDPLLRRQLSNYRDATGVELPLGALVVFLACWRSIYGAVALEVFEHFAPLIADQGPMFEILMQDLMTRLGLPYRPPA